MAIGRDSKSGAARPSSERGARRSEVLQSRRFLSTVAAVSLAVAVASIGVSGVAAQSYAAQKAELEASTTSVLVAAHDIDVGAAIGQGDVTSVAVPNSTVPDDAITSVDQAAGEVASQRIPAKSVITGSALAEPGSGSSAMASRISPGHVALEVSLDAAQRATTSLVAGDHVDVYWNLSATSGSSGTPASTDSNLAAQDVLVLASDSSTDGTPSSESKSSTGTVVLEVTPEQANAITSNGGSVWLATLPATGQEG